MNSNIMRYQFDPTLGKLSSNISRGLGRVLVDRFSEKGFHISFTGNITYKNNDREEVIKALPLDRLLLETDSPFLTPVPFRGKRNDPSKLRYIAQKIADLKNVSIEEVAKVTSENTKKLFKL